jgi:glucan phosphoethanolaminetransferase (alkaline phosphatase superfamily)
MSFREMQEIWSSSTNSKEQLKLSESELNTILIQLIENEKIRASLRMRKRLKSITIILFLYLCLFFFFYGRSTEMTVSISVLALFSFFLFRAFKITYEPIVMDENIATMLKKNRIKLKQIDNVLRYSLIFVAPSILIITTLINLILEKEAISNILVFYLLLLIFIVILFFQKKISNLFVNAAYIKRVDELNNQVDIEIE